MFWAQTISALSRASATLGLTSALAACGGAAGPAPQSEPVSVAPTAAAGKSVCDEALVKSATEQADKDLPVAAALFDRGRRDAFESVARAYADAVVSCPAHPDRVRWLVALHEIFDHSKHPDQAMHAVRAMVCENLYPYGTTPLRLPRQDGATFVDPYAKCEAAPAPAQLVTEGWVALGDYHLERGAPEDGGFGIHRAGAAFLQAASHADTPTGRARAELSFGVTLERRGRLHAAFTAFAAILERGDASLEVLEDARTHAATALASVEFEGPRDEAPFVALDEPTDRAKTLEEMGAMLKPAVERARDPQLLPSDRRWGGEVALELARLLSGLRLPKVAIAAYDVMLTRWPLHADRPAALSELAYLLDGDRQADRAREVREELSHALEPSSPWREANAQDAAALMAAERYRTSY
ncbi:MAG: hypothetical protein U0271_38720 [Polyangiaceae bacterium]